ncbi:type II secretion system F family protein [Mucisphaera sp.]|uniref:type II secretion system F family protein n=1 Tax=Mucisphaera sp. TaxID=2913024 RepID=UPI003D0B7FBD
MPAFSFKARTANGQLDLGVLEAASLTDAGARLRQRGLFPINIQPSKTKPTEQSSSSAAAAPTDRTTVKRSDVILFAHELAILLDAGVSIRDALDAVADQATGANMRAILADIGQRVQAGATLSESLQRYPAAFPKLMISLIQASEASGTLSEMLERVSLYLEQEQKIQRTVRSAMTYPVVMFVATFAITSFLIGFVLPRFASIYASRGADLPLPTQLLLNISYAVTNFWPHMLAAAIATTVASFIFFFRTQPGKRAIDTAKLRLPLIGPLFNKLYLTRSFRTMSVMIDAGVPLLDLIAITREVTTNHHMAKLWDDVADKVQQGGAISTVLNESPLIPKPVSQMIASGERAGRVSDVMKRAASRAEDEFEQGVKAMTQFVEPAMIAVLGIVIGFVAIALLLPIFSVGKVVSGG